MNCPRHRGNGNGRPQHWLGCHFCQQDRAERAEQEAEWLRSAIAQAARLVGTEAAWKIPTILNDALRTDAARSTEPNSDDRCEGEKR